MSSAPFSPSPRPSGPARLVSYRFPWLLLAFVVIVAVWYAPILAERIQYRKTKGEVDAIREGMSGINMPSIAKAFSLVAKLVQPSVVYVQTITFGVRPGDEYSAPRILARPGTGSGVLVETDSNSGYIITNYHVIQNAARINVVIGSGAAIPATIVGFDAANDLAVLRVQAPGLIAAKWGDSDNLEVGEMVWALGAPFGFDHSITFGIVSALGRTVQQQQRQPGQMGPESPLREFIQTDAAMNPGNSGGPLVNSQGEVVGINTAIVGQVNTGISFAIPSNVAREVFDRIKASGKEVARPYLGVALETVTPEFAERNQLPVPKGALVRRVGPGSPAAEAGLRAGDIVVSFDNKPIEDAASLVLMGARARIGSTAKLGVVRDGKEISLEVTMRQRPGE